jgi:hypothetical protein
MVIIQPGSGLFTLRNSLFEPLSFPKPVIAGFPICYPMQKLISDK